VLDYVRFRLALRARTTTTPIRDPIVRPRARGTAQVFDCGGRFVLKLLGWEALITTRVEVADTDLPRESRMVTLT
jgi:hypothetical protein